MADQEDIARFLSHPAAFGGGAGPVEVIETHGARVFLCGETALKLKRAVRYDYMDLSTPEKRHAMLLRERELNAPVAPAIYRDVVPVTREADGRLALDGAGAPVDWVLRMARFPAEDELTRVAARGALDDALATRLGTELAAYHAAAPRRDPSRALAFGAIIDEVAHVLAGFPRSPAAVRAPDWAEAAHRMLAQVAPLIAARAARGAVRRCHGDLHLRNIVLIDGEPVLYDALEFDEAMGTSDIVYDIAFLVMDLCHRGLARQACRVLEAWLLGFDGAEDDGLAILPLCLSLRAAIRAMVALQTAAARGTDGESEARGYIEEACRYLAPRAPVCIAVGGVSGTGKSVLARALTAGTGAAPGAIWLASDVLRKAGGGTVQYDRAARGAVYDRMAARARAILAAGHSVVFDATFLDPARRRQVREVAEAAGVPFAGLWLSAPPDILRDRVAGRRGDPSDADLAVLERQLAGGADAPDWGRVIASGTPQDTLERARAALAPLVPAPA
jgi:aminoglycoside phosphotransferase family enzyme/predicted kinase